MLAKGYAGKVAILDLTKAEAKIVPTERFFKDYGIEPRLWIGGDGFIAKVLWKDITKAIDPLSPENEIVIATGPWTGTASPQAGRSMRLVFPGHHEVCRVRHHDCTGQGG